MAASIFITCDKSFMYVNLHVIYVKARFCPRTKISQNQALACQYILTRLPPWNVFPYLPVYIIMLFPITDILQSLTSIRGIFPMKLFCYLTLQSID
jgi:hypothetical protein